MSIGTQGGVCTDAEQRARLKLIRDTCWSRTQKYRLLKRFGCAEEVYKYPELVTQVNKAQTKQNASPRHSRSQLAQDLTWLEHGQHHLVWFDDEAYPELLREIDDPPIGLFAIGDLSVLKEIKIALIGSRKPTPVGKKITQQLSAELSKLGIVITSGMALGVDGAAHQAALDTGEKTIAVLGCGLDIIYPRRHRHMFEQIAEQGLLLSEYALGSPPTRYSFPQRNRIISGLSIGAIIIEAAKRSGSLITARLAMEQNREVMVVPGSPLNPLYEGSNQLIRDGAALISNAEDVLQVMSISLQSALKDQVCEDPIQSLKLPDHGLLQHINFESTALDQIILESGLTPAEVSSMLLMLELEGVVAATVDGGYTRLA